MSLLIKKKRFTSVDQGVHRKTLKLFIDFLNQKQVISYVESSACPPPDAKQKIVTDFDNYLVNQKNLAASTRIYYRSYVNEFLSKQLKDDQIHLEDLHSEDIINFMINFSKTNSKNQSQLAATSLRSFLNYLIFLGKINVDLSNCIPSVANRREETLPEVLTHQHVKKLLDNCDKKSPIGLRDYTILLLLSRFGFRSCEIMNLLLDDINWDDGEITICGKGSKSSKFPMCQEVGDAIANYLKNSRSPCKIRNLFLCASPPLRAIKSPSTLSDIVRRALVRSGLNPSKKGPHLLRHTVACSILQNGSSLSDVGEILRHQIPQTTAIYAKVDITKLKLLVRTWPLDSSGGTI